MTLLEMHKANAILCDVKDKYQALRNVYQEQLSIRTME